MSAIHLLSHDKGALRIVGGTGCLRINLDANGLPMIPRGFEKRFAEAVRIAIADDKSSAIMAPDDASDFGYLITVRRAREPEHALVSFIDLSALPGNLTSTMLIDLFALTPSEAKVALALYAGQEADELAELRNVAIGTIRSQIKSLLSKTRMRNQKRLIALLSQIALSLPNPVTGAHDPQPSA